MIKEKVQEIINDVFPKIERHYGNSKFQECSPYIELEKSSLKNSCHAEYCSLMNEISIYYSKMKSKKMVIQTLIHEYIHYMQSPIWFKRYYNMGYNYDDHPYELEAIRHEQDYKLFL